MRTRAYPKIVGRSRLREILDGLNGAETVAVANGVFDLLHPGHVQMLWEASKLADVLVVAVNSDASVRRLKGNTRPIWSQDHRQWMLANLGCVDYVTVFAEDTPCKLIEELRPDVLVKGGAPAEVAGREFVESYGGQVVLIPLVGDHSTTNLIDKLRQIG